MPDPTFFRLQLKITVAGQVQLDRRFTRMLADVKDLRPFFEDDALPILREAVAHQFGEGGDPTWRPLSPRYAAAKARRFPGAPLLVRTGALRRSLLEHGARGNITEISSTRLAYGTALETPTGGWNLGLIHHLGAPRARIPARGILRLLRQYKSKVMQALRRHLDLEEERGGL